MVDLEEGASASELFDALNLKPGMQLFSGGALLTEDAVLCRPHLGEKTVVVHTVEGDHVVPTSTCAYFHLHPAAGGDMMTTCSSWHAKGSALLAFVALAGSMFAAIQPSKPHFAVSEQHFVVLESYTSFATPSPTQRVDLIDEKACISPCPSPCKEGRGGGETEGRREGGMGRGSKGAREGTTQTSLTLATTTIRIITTTTTSSLHMSPSSLPSALRR